jgi:hypothetical protein
METKTEFFEKEICVNDFGSSNIYEKRDFFIDMFLRLLACMEETNKLNDCDIEFFQMTFCPSHL